LHHKTTYTLKDRRNGVAEIAVESKLNVPSGTPYSVPGSPSLRFALNGAMTGTTLIDEATGWTQKSTLTYRFSGRMSIKNPSIPGKTISWPLYMKGSVQIDSTLPGQAASTQPSK
jgi:hypothetical protein